jgi:hypothetical protein
MRQQGNLLPFFVSPGKAWDFDTGFDRPALTHIS